MPPPWPLADVSGPARAGTGRTDQGALGAADELGEV